ncbi:RES family NAD+ phosphorylase [Paraburkholderia youngii]|uniref:RES family NAD+ phosphorylase n=1 Tax=Paraburkholderia youngii TaxID=2782701 RepID=UPI003D25D786
MTPYIRNKDKRICACCVAEPFLKAQITGSDASDEDCDYCGQAGPTTSLAELATQIDRVISEYYTLTSMARAVVHFDRDPAGESLLSILGEWLSQDDERPSYDLNEVLLERWDDGEGGAYGDDPWFIRWRGPSWDLSLAWNRMEKSLQEEARLVNPLVVATLEQVFGALHSDRTGGGESLMLEIGPDTLLQRLYRARVFQTREALQRALEHPERELGPPAPAFAAAGRMNARGVSVFYGAVEAATALREVRPPVGSDVVVAEFKVIRPLRLLNLTALRAARADTALSLFDPATAAVVERSDFLTTLESKLIAPVMPAFTDDGYLITQAVADFLSTHPRLNLDGIYFPSVQSLGGAQDAVGHNVILFHKAALVLHSRAGEEIATRASLAYERAEDEWLGPNITTLAPPAEASLLPALGDEDDIEPSLELQRNSVVIHTVRGVEIVTDSMEVEHTVAQSTKARTQRPSGEADQG